MPYRTQETDNCRITEIAGILIRFAGVTETEAGSASPPLPSDAPTGEGGPGPARTGGPSGGTGVGAAGEHPRAARRTTIVLAAALLILVVMTGVLGAIAVLMTRNPDVPPLSRPQVVRLYVPVHFAPVAGVAPAPCTGTDGIPDDKDTTCYLLEPGVTVTSVQKIEQRAERDGTYSIRLVLSPETRDDVAELIKETVNGQLAIVAQDRVVAAPRVAQEISQDSLGIAGFTKEQADAFYALLTGGAAPPSPQPAG